MKESRLLVLPRTSCYKYEWKNLPAVLASEILTSDCSDYGLLAGETVYFCRQIPTIRRNILPPSSVLKYVGKGLDLSTCVGCPDPRESLWNGTHYRPIRTASGKTPLFRGLHSSLSQ
jgi:hypothetical protein